MYGGCSEEFFWGFTGDIYGGHVQGNWSGVSVRIRMQDYKSLRPAGMIRATLVDTHTQTGLDPLCCKLDQQLS